MKVAIIANADYVFFTEMSPFQITGPPPTPPTPPPLPGDHEQPNITE